MGPVFFCLQHIAVNRSSRSPPKTSLVGFKKQGSRCGHCLSERFKLKKSLLAILATISLTVVGLVSGVAPANAVYNTEDALKTQSILRKGNPTISGTNLVASVTLGASESFSNEGYRSLSQYASVTATVSRTAGQAIAFTGSVVNTAGNASALDSSETETIKVFYTKVGETEQGIWNSETQNVADLPTGEFKDFQVYRLMPLASGTAGTYQATTGLSVAGVAVAIQEASPQVSQALNQAMVYNIGFNISWLGGVAYTPTTDDYQYRLNSRACIVAGEQNVTANSVIRVTYKNVDVSNNSFSGSDNVFFLVKGVSNQTLVSDSATQANDIHTITLTNPLFTNLELSATAYIFSPTANEIKPVLKAWVDGDVSETNVIQACPTQSSGSQTGTPAASPSATVVRSEPVLSGFAGHKVANSGGRNFSLDASSLTVISEVSLNGKKLTYVKDAKGMLTIELPKNLKRGGSYDLVVNSAEGNITVVGAIVLAADLPFVKKTPRAFAGRSTALSASQVRDIRALVNASEFGDTVTCTAYVSGAATDAIAIARATNSCAAATAVNPELKTVIRTAPAIFSLRNKVRVVIG